MKRNKGITLVALIITIVVMLILVAVSVNVLIKSNLIGTAEKTVGKYKTASEEEAKGGTITIEGKEYDSIEDYLKGKEKLPNIEAGERAEANFNYKGVTIPKGFTVSGIEDEQSVDGGLVIYDIPEGKTVDWTNPDSVKTAYNQFVWIPVEVTSSDTETNIAAFRKSKWIANAETGGERTTGLSEEHTEPYSYDANDYDASTGIKTQIANLIKSIYKYGGFYIGRYEAGSETVRTKSSGTTVLGIKQDMYPYTYVIWGDSMENIGTTGAVYLSNNLYNTETYGATSMLCTGACWESMLEFIKDSSHDVIDSTAWGNYKDASSFEVNRGAYAVLDTSNSTLGNFNNVENTYSKTEDIAILLTTGATERNSAKNIYDVAGNCYEWTTESYSSNERIVRGR